MRPIFISYRRDDTEGQAGRLFEDLREAFGADAVFMDVATIEPGVDFRRAIEKHTAMCGALLALIGRNWLSAKNDQGQRRLDDPNDYVRLETAAALRRDIPVVPVLVRDATMVRAEDLPEDLKELAFRNGVELTHARWESDVQLLIKALRPLVLGDAAAPAAPSAPAPLQTAAAPIAAAGARRRLGVPLAVLLLAGAAAVAVGLWFADRQGANRRAQAVIAQAQQAAKDKATAEQALADKLAADKAIADRQAADRAAANKQAAERAEAERAAARKKAAEKLAADREAADQAAAERRIQEEKRAAQAKAAANGECLSGYVWREAFRGDKVCVTPQIRSRTEIENSRAAMTREPAGGAYGPSTCKQGYVWREAAPADLVCVVPASRDQARADNAAAAARRVRPPAAAAAS
jgi:flagellar biosynthesis GTPase FlhF